MKEEDLITTKNKNSTQELIEDSITYGSSVIADKFPILLMDLRRYNGELFGSVESLKDPLD